MNFSYSWVTLILDIGGHDYLQCVVWFDRRISLCSVWSSVEIPLNTWSLFMRCKFANSEKMLRRWVALVKPHVFGHKTHPKKDRFNRINIIHDSRGWLSFCVNKNNLCPRLMTKTWCYPLLPTSLHKKNGLKWLLNRVGRTSFLKLVWSLIWSDVIIKPELNLNLSARCVCCLRVA